MKAAFVRQGKDRIVKARAVEDRQMHDTRQVARYDLLPKLQTLKIPTLVIWGDHDFFPREIAAHIAQAIPHAQLVALKDCGHFAYMECPAEVRNATSDFFRGTGATGRPH
ncbi:MAG TPA: alpha/beta fold hydrolase [Bryobacteraceae bacterium]|jgi:proline iminopeptidase|nr:alpha/beta fold hydrolase [Bryobacteraceae bacterium]